MDGHIQTYAPNYLGAALNIAGFAAGLLSAPFLFAGHVELAISLAALALFLVG